MGSGSTWAGLLALGLLAGPTGAGAASGAREEPSLVAAARHSDLDQAQALLRQGADVHQSTADGTTALHWASHRDDLAMAQLLIRAGAHVDAANDLGATPLWNASENGSAAMVHRLLEAGADPNVALPSGETSLMMAARAGAPGVVTRLLAGGADPDMRASRGQTALMWAVVQRHADVVDVLLAHGVDVHAHSDVWSQVMAVPPHGLPENNRDIPHGGNTALLFAARIGALDAARLLVAAGASVDDQDAWGVSATVLAAHSGFADLLDFLLEEGAEPNAMDAGFSALHTAIIRRDERMTRALLDHGADPNAPLAAWTPKRRTSRDWHFPPSLIGATPFWLAARLAEAEIMRQLAAHGADASVVHDVQYRVNSFRRQEPRHDTTTALMAAAGMGPGVQAWIAPRRIEPEDAMLAAVTVALEHGADPNSVDLEGDTVLHAAARLRRNLVIARLVEHGANLQAKNHDGLTPLAAAIALEPVSPTVDLLQSLAANPGRPDPR